MPILLVAVFAGAAVFMFTVKLAVGIVTRIIMMAVAGILAGLALMWFMSGVG